MEADDLKESVHVTNACVCITEQSNPVVLISLDLAAQANGPLHGGACLIAAIDITRCRKLPCDSQRVHTVFSLNKCLLLVMRQFEIQKCTFSYSCIHNSGVNCKHYFNTHTDQVHTLTPFPPHPTPPPTHTHEPPHKKTHTKQTTQTNKHTIIYYIKNPQQQHTQNLPQNQHMQQQQQQQTHRSTHVPVAARYLLYTLCHM